MEPIDYYNDPQLAQAQGDYQQAAGAYKTAETNAATMPDLLKQALDKKFSENNPLISERSGAAANYMNEVTNAPQSVLPQYNNGMVFNPQEQANMINSRRSGALIPLMNANELLSWQQGGITNAVDSATKNYLARAKAAQMEAENKRNIYTDLLDIIDKKANIAFKEKELKNKNGSGGMTDNPLYTLLLEGSLGVDLNGDGKIGLDDEDEQSNLQGLDAALETEADDAVSKDSLFGPIKKEQDKQAASKTLENQLKGVRISGLPTSMSGSTSPSGLYLAGR